MRLAWACFVFVCGFLYDMLSCDLGLEVASNSSNAGREGLTVATTGLLSTYPSSVVASSGSNIAGPGVSQLAARLSQEMHCPLGHRDFPPDDKSIFS